MRYRKLSPTGDYVFGNGQADFYVNTPEAVAQAVQTTLKLWLGEWYLDTTVGVPYLEGVLGFHSQEMADNTILSQIGNVQGVVNVKNYRSTIDSVTRAYSASCLLDTIYGPTQLEIANMGNF